MRTSSTALFLRVAETRNPPTARRFTKAASPDAQFGKSWIVPECDCIRHSLITDGRAKFSTQMPIRFINEKEARSSWRPPAIKFISVQVPLGRRQ